MLLLVNCCAGEVIHVILDFKRQLQIKISRLHRHKIQNFLTTITKYIEANREQSSAIICNKEPLLGSYSQVIILMPLYSHYLGNERRYWQLGRGCKVTMASP